ncbi:glycosyl transferase family 2 [Duganella sp. Leaf126]|uniref:glycosyltransferase family 2 protein n=1 Tax=Duganella sp. Leaf126 TaxID=1736266 RepID=UPI0007018841|nr:glycosyltransferase family 2 protein [Duganella sp. Leaf126]KQQ33655.1 glycosyl transferase family 2 [Duganella sp. Leaf126]
MQQTVNISVVIATYNRPDALRAVIEAFFLQDEQQFEVIVADDGSTDNTRACVAELQARAPFPLRHIWQEDCGFRLARARNLGIAAAQGDYLIFLDGDCIPQPSFIRQHRKLAEPGYMVTGSRVLLSEALTAQVLAGAIDPLRTSAWGQLKLRLSGGLNKLLQLWCHLPDLRRKSDRFSWRRIKGCNMAAWRSDIERINGFDESFTGWGHEDADFVLRLFNAGVLRKDGAFATEVLHLWHREAVRDQASSNQARVAARMQDKTVRATLGLAK